MNPRTRQRLGRAAMKAHALLCVGCLVWCVASCAEYWRRPTAVQTLTDAVCLGITAVTEDGTAHNVCATAQDLAPFVDAIVRAQRERERAQNAAPKLERMADFAPMRVPLSQLAAADCVIPANHPSQARP